MAAPVAYRTSLDKYTPSFPPVVYYRDTFGLDDAGGGGIGERRMTESGNEVSDTDSIATKSTVRTTVNIHHFPMYESTGSKMSKMTPSYHVEQLVTSRILTDNPRTLYFITLVAFASAVQLLIFSLVCLFFDGAPYYVAITVCLLLIANTIVVYSFVKCRNTRGFLLASCITASLSVVESVALFFWTAYLINTEDSSSEHMSAKDIRIISSTRIALYSLQMVFAPVHAIASAICVYILYRYLSTSNEDTIRRGYFLSEPQVGHQKILVPIELRHVRQSSDDDVDNASIGVQTSGTRNQAI